MIHTSEIKHSGSQFPSEKISWSSLKSIIERDELASLQRSAKQEEFYKNYTNKVKQNWRSIYDFILYHKFDYEVITVSVSLISASELKEVDDDDTLEGEKVECKGAHSLLPPLLPPPSGMKWAAKQPQMINDDIAGKRQVLARNDFPYYFHTLGKLAGTRGLRPGFSEPASLRTLPLLASFHSFLLFPFPPRLLTSPPFPLSFILFVYTPPIHLSFSSPDGIKIS